MTPEEIEESRKFIAVGRFDANAPVEALADYFSRALDALEEARRDWQHAIEEASAQACIRITRHEAEIASLESKLSEVREELRQAEEDKAHMELQRDEARAGAWEEVDELRAQLSASQAREEATTKIYLERLDDYDKLRKEFEASQSREEKLRGWLTTYGGHSGGCPAPGPLIGAPCHCGFREVWDAIQDGRPTEPAKYRAASTKPPETPDEIPDHRGASDEELSKLPVLKLPPTKPSETEPKRCSYLSSFDGGRCNKDAGHGGLHFISDEVRAPSGTERNQP